MNQFRAVSANKRVAHHLCISVKPQVLGEFGDSHSLVIFGRHEVISLVAFVKFKPVLHLYIIFIDIVGLEPTVEIIFWHCLVTLEDAFGIEFVFAA